jgi:hypothetical protein
VLSKSYAPPRLQREIDTFLIAFPSLVAALPSTEFATAREAVVTRLREPDRTLSEAYHSRWAPIEHEDHDWGTRATLASLVEATSQADVVALAKAVAPRPPPQLDVDAGALADTDAPTLWPEPLPRLLVQVYGNPHVGAFAEEDSSGARDVTDWESWRREQPLWPDEKMASTG